MLNNVPSTASAPSARLAADASPSVKPLNAAPSRRNEVFRFSGLPAGTVVQVTYGTDTGWTPRRAGTNAEGMLRLSVPVGNQLKLHWQVDGVTTELVIAPVGPRAVGHLRAGLAAAVPVGLVRTPGGTSSPAVVSIDASPPPLPVPVPVPVPRTGFRTPPATVDANGGVVQPPLAKGLLGRDAVMVVGDSLSDDAFHSGSLHAPGRTWAGQLESKLSGAAAADQQGERRYVMSVAKHGETALKGRFNRQQRAGLNDRLDAALKANKTPGTVVLALGANDFRAGTPAAKVGTALKAAIDLIAEQSPGTRIVLAGVGYPSNYGAGDTAARSQRASDYAGMFVDVAGHLAKVAGRTGAPSAFVADLFKDLRDARGQLKQEYRANPKEAIHPNAKGHAQMLATLTPALGLPSAPTKLSAIPVARGWARP